MIFSTLLLLELRVSVLLDSCPVLLGPPRNNQSQSHTSPTVQVFGAWEEAGEPPRGGVVWPRQQVFQCRSEANSRPIPHTATGNLISGRPSFQVHYLLCLEGVQEACVGPSISAALRLCTSPRGEPDSQCSVQTNTPALPSTSFQMHLKKLCF